MRYDVETGFYYLQSRYYDPIIGRFINLDRFVSTGTGFGGFNMFAYCNNNPISYVDYTGSCYGYPNNPNLDSFNSGVKWGIMCGNYGYHVRHKRSPNFEDTTAIITSIHDANKRPYNGEPGSTWTAPNGDKRTYGPDGTPEQDYDHSDHGYPDKHPHDDDGGHWHDWDNGKRGPAYDRGWERVVSVGTTVICIAGIVYVVANDITGVGVADDALLAPLYGGIVIAWS